MMPTDARVGYDWLTPANDWTDGTPKFLAATYVRPKTQTASSDGRRYGGFIVRVYFDGQLQDSRATPPGTINAVPDRGSACALSECGAYFAAIAPCPARL